VASESVKWLLAKPMCNKDSGRE